MAERHGHIINVIVCEDVRQELNNQNTLIGVFAGDILVKEFPASMRIAVYAEYIIAKPAAHDMRFRISYQGEARHEIMDIRMRVPESARDGIAFAFPPTNLMITEPGRLIVEVNYGGDQEWIELTAKRGEKAAMPSPGGASN